MVKGLKEIEQSVLQRKNRSTAVYWACGSNIATFSQAIKNVARVYNTIVRRAYTEYGYSNKVVRMPSYHSECGTAHCIAGWAEIIFEGTDCDDSPEAGVKYIWPVAHLFWETHLSQSQVLKRMERFLESVGYEIVTY